LAEHLSALASKLEAAIAAKLGGGEAAQVGTRLDHSEIRVGELSTPVT
jgi:hypothetical protein